MSPEQQYIATISTAKYDPGYRGPYYHGSGYRGPGYRGPGYNPSNRNPWNHDDTCFSMMGCNHYDFCENNGCGSCRGNRCTSPSEDYEEEAFSNEDVEKYDEEEGK